LMRRQAQQHRQLRQQQQRARVSASAHRRTAL
jgi:hypothetical protein